MKTKLLCSLGWLDVHMTVITLIWWYGYLQDDDCWLCLRPGSQWCCAVAEIIRRDAGRKIQGAHNSTNDPDFLRLIEKHLVDQKTPSLVSWMFAVFTCGSPCIYSKMGSQWTQDSKAADERNWHDLREEWTKCYKMCLFWFSDSDVNRTATGNGSQQRTCFQRACRAAEPKCPNLGLFLDLLMFHLSVRFYTHSNFWNTKDLEPWFAIGSVSQFDLSVFLQLLSPLKVKHFSELLASRDRQRERE